MTIRSVTRGVSQRASKIGDVDRLYAALLSKFEKTDVVQSTGQSTEMVMSQKAVTDLVGDVESVLVAINGEP